MMRRFTRLTAAAGLLLALGMALVPMEPEPALAQTVAPGVTVALTGARLIDGTGTAPIEPATIVMSKGRVVAVGPASSVEIPAGATRMDVAGKTIVPGLISAHTHIAIQRRDNESPEYPELWFDERSKLSDREQLLGDLRIFADFGITSIFSMGEDVNRGFSTPAQVMEVVKLRDEQGYAAEEGQLDRTRVFLSGVSMRGIGGPIPGQATGEDCRQAVVHRRAVYRSDFIKINVSKTMTPEIYAQCIDEAHQRGVKVLAHIATLEEAKGVVNANIDGLGHSVRDADVDAELIAEMKRKGVAMVATLTQEESEFLYDPEPDFFKDPFFLRQENAFRKQMEGARRFPTNVQRQPGRPTAASGRARFAQALRNLKLLSDAGVLIAMGTDAGGRREAIRFPGYFEHREMTHMVAAGMTPMQVIVAATSGSARAMGMDGDLGTLQRGKSADLLVLNGNPLTDFSNLRKIDAVWIGGRPIRRPANTN